MYFKPAIKGRYSKWQCINVIEYFIIYFTSFSCRSEKEWLRVWGFDGMVVNTSEKYKPGLYICLYVHLSYIFMTYKVITLFFFVILSMKNLFGGGECLPKYLASGWVK